MVHPDFDVTRLEKNFPRDFVNAAFFGSFGDVLVLKNSLNFFNPRDERETIERDPIGAEFHGELSGFHKFLGVLFRKPVNQVVVHRLKADLAREFGDPPSDFRRLNTVHYALNFWIEVLDAEADPAKSEFMENFEMCARRPAGIDLDRPFEIVWIAANGGENRGQHSLEFIRSEERRSSPAEVKLTKATLADLRNLFQIPIPFGQ